MLLEYSVSNFKSFRDETTLSLIASKDTSKTDESVITSKFKETRLLNCAVIYGPNGSGKSNLFFSLYFLRNFVLNSLRNLDNNNQEVNVVPFLLEICRNKAPSSFHHQGVRRLAFLSDWQGLSIL